MPNQEIKTRVTLQGETEYQNGIRGIRTELEQLNATVKAVTKSVTQLNEALGTLAKLRKQRLF